MNLIRKLFIKNKVPTIIDPLIGKTVIRFTTHGCMGQDHRFDFIGKIVDITYPIERNPDSKFYKVLILKDETGERRDHKQDVFAEVPSWYLQDLGGDFLITYDV